MTLLNQTANTYPPYVTSLPGSPQDGDVIRFGADATNGVTWLLAYRALSASAYKWEAIGNTVLFGEATNNVTDIRSTSTYLNLSTPSIVLPLAGDYEVTVGAQMVTNFAQVGGIVSYTIGATAADDADGARGWSTVANFDITAARTRVKTGLAAVTLTMRAKNLGGDGTSARALSVSNRWISARPIRVG